LAVAACYLVGLHLDAHRFGDDCSPFAVVDLDLLVDAAYFLAIGSLGSLGIAFDPCRLGRTLDYRLDLPLTYTVVSNWNQQFNFSFIVRISKTKSLN
jgi:hypothetical protein